MKIPPPQFMLLYCLNRFKQNYSVSDKKVISFRRFMNVEKTSLKLIKKNNSSIVTEGYTSWNTIMPIHHNIYSMQKITDLKEIRDYQKSTFQFYNRKISTFQINAKFDLNSDFALRIHRRRTS